MAIIGLLIYVVPMISEFMDSLSNQQMNRIMQIGDILKGKIDSRTTTQRSDLWVEGISIIARYPITGHGFGSFGGLPEGRLGVHNTYLMVLGEGGIFPFISFMGFVILVFYRSTFWIRDANYRFLSLAICVITFIQIYGASNGGIKTSEPVAMTAILFGILYIMKGKRQTSKSATLIVQK